MEAGNYHAGWFSGEPEEFFFSDIYRKNMKPKTKKLQFQTRYEKRLMWPIVLCKLLKIMTIHLGDAQTTTFVNLVILWAGSYYARIRRRRQKCERRRERTGIGKRRGGGEGEFEQSLYVVMLPSCNYPTDHLSTRLISWRQKTGMWILCIFI